MPPLSGRLRFAGGAHRDYLIVHEQGRGKHCGRQPPRTEVRSFADAAPAAGDLDFRKRKDAAKLVKALEDFDPAAE